MTKSWRASGRVAMVAVLISTALPLRCSWAEEACSAVCSIGLPTTVAFTATSGLSLSEPQRGVVNQEAATDWKQEPAYSEQRGIVPPVLISEVDPVPPTLSTSAPSCDCQLRFVVGSDGHTHEITLSNGVSPAFDRSVVDAVSQFTFIPAMKDSRAVSVWVTLELRINMPFKRRKGLIPRHAY